MIARIRCYTVSNPGFNVRATEEMCRRIFEAVPEGIWTVDHHGRTIFCNERMAEIIGTDIESMSERSCFESVFPADLEQAQRQFARNFAGDRQPFDFRLRRMDGSPIWVSISCMLMCDDSGAAIGLLGLFTDISERKRAEAALRESEKRFRATFFQAAVGMTLATVEGEWLTVNERFCEIIGYNSAELSGKTFLDITHPDDRDACLAFVRRLLDGEISSYSTERRYVRKGGTTVWVKLHVSLVRDQDNLPQYFVGLVEDVTARIEAERALRDSEENLKLAQRAARLGVWDCDLRTNTTVVSGEYARLHGLTPDHPPLTHEEWLGLIHAEDRERVQVLLRRSVEQTHEWDGEFRVLWPDGSVHWLLGKGQVFLDPQGQPARMVGVSLDITEQKQAEAALYESEARFRNMADSAPVMIWISGLDKRCIFCNKPWLDFTGRTMEQELGNGWLGGMHPEDLDRCRATYYSSFDAHRRFQIEYRLRRAGGEYRWLLNTGTPLYRGGDFVGFIGSCIDMTEQKLIEERLRASEARLTDAQRLAKVGSWERNIEADRIDWSDEMLRMLGLTNNAPPNFSTFLGYVHPKDRENILRADSEVRSNVPPVDVEYRIIRPDGEARFVRSIVEAIRNEQGAPVRIVGATQDVTDQIQARELLRESEGRLKNAERLAHVGHWYWDIRANRITGSEEMFRIFGKPSDFIPTYEQFLRDIIPQDRERIERETRECLEGKSGYSTEYQIALPNGDLRTINAINEVARDEEGSPVQMFGACQDVTDFKRAQEEALARQKLETVGTLANGIAHDFNNLLGAVLAQAELAETDLTLGLVPSEEIQRIKSVAIRGAEIVRELMLYAGRDQTALVEAVDVSRLAEEMLELLKVSISKHAVLKTDLPDNLLAARGNAAQIRQVVMNLIVNASEAIGEKEGSITLTTAQVNHSGKLASNSATDLPPGDYIRLEVSDTGCGMTETVKAKIFDPFFSTKFAGRGLGLAIVQGIIRAHGGAIVLMSSLGRGTTFQVFLPCTPQGAAEGTITSAGVEPSLARVGTILVVEDEETLRLAISKALRRRGLSVMEAGNGSEAMHLLRTHKNEIDGVLLDVTIPGTSSREVFDKIQRMRPDLKVIVTSAYSKETVDALFAGFRVDHFIRKPFQLGDLARLLGEILSVKSGLSPGLNNSES